MKSKNYREILNHEYKVRELTEDEFDNTLMHFAILYHKEQLKSNNYEQKAYETGYNEGAQAAADEILNKTL